MLTSLKRNIQNIQGSSSSRKLIVFESDDWGSIRMPSIDVFNKLKRENYNPGSNPYLKNDTLASATDMDALYEILQSVKDKNNNPAIITANAVMGNPNFERIKEFNFEKYFWEPFTTTWEKYPHCKGVDKIWQQGQNEKLIRFQCHGREHLNVDQWMLNLQKKNPLLRKAFEHKMISISSQPSNLRFNFMEGLDFFTEEEQQNKQIIIEESLLHFENYFGYKSKSFIANCYIWDNFAEKILANNGVQYLQGISNQIIPVLHNRKHSHNYIRHYLGQKNYLNQTYLVRNAFFEPSLDTTKNWIDECLHRIKIAFRWGKPAIIGCHRLNFMGEIDEKNRTNNLLQLKSLLIKMIKLWPDLEFTTSDKVMRMMKNES